MTRATCDLLLITARRLSDDDHGAGVRTARLAEVLTEQYDVVVAEPAPAGRAARTAVSARGDHRVLEFEPAPLDLRRALAAPATEGASIWSGVDQRALAAMNDLEPRMVFWADAILASAGLRDVAPDAAHVVEFANVESRRYLAMTLDGSMKRRAFAAWEALKAVRWQRATGRGAQAIVALTARDALKLPSRGPRIVVRNGFPGAAERPSPSSGSTVLAVGSWWYGPNRHGMLRFLRKEWPKIRGSVPDARLLIVGRGGDELVSDPIRGVEALGFVNDLEPVYRDCAVVLAPARSGGGSQLKLVAALAHGRVVAGPRYLRREIVPGMPVGVIQGSADVAGAVSALLCDVPRRHTLEAAAAAYAARASWSHAAEPLLRFFDGQLARAPQASPR